jgi:hypothetical protein
MKWLMKMANLPNRLTLGLLALLAVGACAYHGDQIGNPFVRRFQWFSYVGGDDIRAACAAGAADRYRLVYNGFWEEQVRIYELGLSGPLELDQRTLDGLDLSDVSSDDLAAPWRGQTARATLGPAQYDQLIAAFRASGLFEPPPIGLLLPSDGFYWTAVGCRQGRFYYNAWLYPSDRFAGLVFPRLLLAFDRTGVPFNSPDSQGWITNYSQQQLDRERWFIQVETGGFSGS